MTLPLRRAARLGTIAAGGAAAGGLLALLGVLGVQLATAKRRPSVDPRTAPDLPTDFGDPHDPLCRLVVLGDSFAASVGATDPRRSLGERVATNLADAGFRVHARSVAVPNSRSSDVRIQASRALITSETDPYDVALIMVGAMDACAWSGLADVERSTFRTVAALRNAGIAVVLATTPDLGASTCVAAPLRSIWAWRSGVVAKIQHDAGRSAGAVVVNCVNELGPAFYGDPTLLAADGFHPSSDGYQVIADAVSPAVIDAARTARQRA